MGRAIRRLLVPAVRLFVERPARLLALVAAALAVLAAVLLVPLLLPRAAGPAAGLALPGAGPAEPPATAEFMRGNREYDGSLIWNSFGDEALQRLISQGVSAEAFQAQMQAARERGARLDEVTYIGGKELPDGTSRQFYLVAYRQSSRADVEYVPYLFTLDAGGKIARVQ